MKYNSVDFNKIKLKNGITLINEFVPSVESYALGIAVKAGARHHPTEKAGLAHFLEHANFRRTKNRDSKQIAAEFESLGAYTNAFTNQEYTCFYVRALKSNFNKCFELLSDLVLNPVFIDNEIDKERKIILEEIKSYEDDPEDYIFDIADKLLFGEHQLGFPIVGTSKSVKKIKSFDLEEFHTNFYIPENITISLSGNVDSAQILENLNKLDFGKSKDLNYERMTPEILPSKTSTIKRSIQQAHIMLAKRTEGITSSERFPLAVLNVLFGDSMSSRLYQNLREKHGIAYSIYSTLQFFPDAGAFYIYAGTDPKKLNKVETLIMKEIELVRKNYLSEEEINRAKEQLKSSVIMELESMSARMQSMVKNEIFLQNYESTKFTIDAIDNVNADNLNKIIDKYFNNENWSKALILPK